jgi:hypothetical protein
MLVIVLISSVSAIVETTCPWISLAVTNVTAAPRGHIVLGILLVLFFRSTKALPHSVALAIRSGKNLADNQRNKKGLNN